MDDKEDLSITNKACARIPTDQGEFQLCVFTNNQDDKEHLALIMGNVFGKKNVLVRVHSECFTGDVLGSRRCDCGEQLNLAMSQIAQAGEGVLIYLRQEGRGIGLLEKLRAYNLQDQGYDTVEANLMLGHQADEREYTMAARILENLHIASIRLLTNNPLKIEQMQNLGVPVTERVPLQPTVTADNAEYLFTKVRRMNHLLNLNLMHLEVPQRGNGTL
jgi:GTP cyclohydrolase II